MIIEDSTPSRSSWPARRSWPARLACSYVLAAARVCCLAFAAAILSAPSFAADPAVPADAQRMLVQRDAIRLNLAGAERALKAALVQAEEMQLKVNISVVDDGGHLVAFARMDGARPGSVYTSLTKATTAALIRGETGPLPSGDTVNTHLSLAVENAAAVSGGKFTTLKGGVPIVIDDQVVGALGVGGATGEQDQQIARAGAAALSSAAAQPRYRPAGSDAKPAPE